ncbi:MAG: hypothetical protein HYX61_11210 [Gammaproteobacteria bacterium]|nr:hypothetical protein [Gammaproteobacteria bacterium]
MPSMKMDLNLIEQLLLKMYQISVMYPEDTSDNFKNALRHDSLKVKALGGISLTFNQSQNQNLPLLDDCLLSEDDIENIHELSSFEELKALSQEDKAAFLRTLISMELVMLIQVHLAICIQDISRKDLISAAKLAKKRNIIISLPPTTEPDELEIPPSDDENESLENNMGDESQVFRKDSSHADNVEIEVQNQFFCYRLYQKLKTNFTYYFPSFSNEAQITDRPKYK